MKKKKKSLLINLNLHIYISNNNNNKPFPDYFSSLPIHDEDLDNVSVIVPIVH